MTRAVDHVTVAGADLDELRAAFEACGFETVYGGEHDNGVTHMAVVGFEDRSYVELIAKRAPGVSPWWDVELDGEAGPCAWAVPTDDIVSEAERLGEEGFTVDGPAPYARERPDRTVARWELADIDGGTLGAPLPMLIEDETPLSNRVTVTSPRVECGIGGVETVVVATNDATGLTDRVERFFGTPRGDTREDGAFAARVTAFPDAPVALAEPLDEGSWLGERLSRFGPGPCAYLFGTNDPDRTRERLSVAESGRWGETHVDWLDIPLPGRYGVVESR